jgi:hypothetical protein
MFLLPAVLVYSADHDHAARSARCNCRFFNEVSTGQRVLSA